jgi:hypothetical protein
MSEPTGVSLAQPQPCGHPCTCHAINTSHVCGHPRTGIVLNLDEEQALVRILDECGPQALVETVNRLLTATAAHQFAEGIKSGEMFERVRIEQALMDAINPPSPSQEHPHV